MTKQAPHAPGLRWSERIYRMLLMVYPVWYRRPHGADLAEFFRDRYREEYARKGWWGVVGVWARSALDVVVSGLGERWRGRARTRGADHVLKENRVETLLQDIRYTFRGFRRRPGFAAVVVVTLALGIGANTAIFTVVNSVLLRPLPYRDAQQLMLVWGRMSSTDVTKAPWSGPDLLDFRERADAFDGLAGAFGINSTLTGDFEPEPVTMGMVTANFFDVLGVDPILGRGFALSDELNLDPQVFFDPNATLPPGVTMLSHEVWERRFGADSAIIGTSVQVNGQGMTIVGVAPEGFRFFLPADAAMPAVVDVWVVIPMDQSQGTRDQQGLAIVGRLEPGVEPVQAQTEMDAIAAQFRSENQFHANVGMEIDVVPMLRDVVGHVEPVLFALLGAVGFVLLIACANVANLLLIRAQARQREIAIRAALGGGRGRIVRQMLTESGVLALLGGGVGLFLAYAGIDLLIALKPENLPRIESVGIDGVVLVFVLGLSVLAAMLFGTLPALQSSRPDLNSSLKERAQGVSGHHRVRNALVVTEIAFSLILLIGSGLMVRSFAELQRVEPGFDSEGVLTLNVGLPFFKYNTPGSSTDLHLQIAREIKTLPGVDAVSAVTPLPLGGGGQFWFGPYALHEANDEEWSRNESDYRPSLPGLFEALGTRVLAGRGFTEADSRVGARSVVVVDEKMVETAWSGENPVGERVMIVRPSFGEAGFERYWAEVVGVVEHVRYDDVRFDGRETIYIPHSEWGWADLNYVVRASVDLTTLIEPIRQVVRNADPDIPAATPVPFNSFVDEALAPTRFALVLIAVFSGVALVLSSVGLYGVVSYSVRQRTQELAVRMAFGAGRDGIIRMVLRQGLVLTGIGAGVGIAGSLLLSRAVSTLLFGITPVDPVTYGTLTVMLGVVAMGACVVPAVRATRVEPVEALKAE
jgi:putative ABC transport system permease protein